MNFRPSKDSVQSFFSEGRTETSKSAINFPWDEPVPVDLITKIAQSVMALPGKAAKTKIKSAQND